MTPGSKSISNFHHTGISGIPFVPSGVFFEFHHDRQLFKFNMGDIIMSRINDYILVILTNFII